MLAMRLYLRLRARFAAGMGQFRNTILPRHAGQGASRRAISALKRRHTGISTPH
jgi:hypothetical protein